MYISDKYQDTEIGKKEEKFEKTKAHLKIETLTWHLSHQNNPSLI